MNGFCLAMLILATVPNANESFSADCWNANFTWANCCNPRFGPEGNHDCWDELCTFDFCCDDDQMPVMHCRDSEPRRSRYSINHAYVINLESRPDRLQSITKQFDAACLPFPLKVIPGVGGNLLFPSWGNLKSKSKFR